MPSLPWSGCSGTAAKRGKRKLESITRYSTLALGLLQGFGYYMLIRTNGFLSNTSVWAAVVIVATFTAGSVFVMWMGEQITEHGVGNGISILLFAGIISRLPSAVFYMYTGAKNWANDVSGDNAIVLHPALIPVFLIGMCLILVFIVFISLSGGRFPSSTPSAWWAGRCTAASPRPFPSR